jgi:hypothetical protein
LDYGACNAVTLLLSAGVLLSMVPPVFNAVSATKSFTTTQQMEMPVLPLFSINFMLHLITTHATLGEEVQDSYQYQ